MVIKIDWKKIGYKEYHAIHFSPASNIDACSIINIDERHYIGPFDLHHFNTTHIHSKEIPFPINGIVYMRCLDLNTQRFPDIENILEFTDKVLNEVERFGRYESSFMLELLDTGVSMIAGLDLNENQFRTYKFIKIL